ncbi:hypothetical protein K504DRAFT_466996 [Pleomassaria siparia CBS 279.74]|uniref:Uncharacterized protein n=1 Tax=Pleomassaria siparia CBS 279.74 TaxID=1314801 RepID=A0A6G1KD80_9PLEO|nr:hypothetical protein K504DRAFT_466996 [Pleomassaria siparia CBS 279.74]
MYPDRVGKFVLNGVVDTEDWYNSGRVTGTERLDRIVETSSRRVHYVPYWVKWLIVPQGASHTLSPLLQHSNRVTLNSLSRGQTGLGKTPKS